MGRIKSTAIKNLARDILEEHGDKFSTDFEKNKKLIEGIRSIESKKIKNVVAGYITKEIRRKENAS
jgi:small subunit ribosomal protein S17e